MTETTDSSRYINCCIREKRIVNTPEESVRQKLLHRLVHDLGFPRALIAVERKVGSRRFDIVVYSRQMRPLLLIECKAELLGDAFSQAFGYNWEIQAPFVAVASKLEEKTFWREKDRIASSPFIPKYQELSDAAERL